MKRAIQSLARKLAQFRNDHRGVAAVEFALVVPVMLTLYMGAMEASMMITMDRKVQSVAGAVGDLVARADGTLTTAQLRDYFQASAGIMTPYTNTGVKQTITLVEVQSNGKNTILWSREFLNGVLTVGTTRKVNTAYPLSKQMTAIAQNNENRWVIAAEAATSYKPLYGLVFDKAIPLYRENFYTPRNGKAIVMN